MSWTVPPFTWQDWQPSVQPGANVDEGSQKNVLVVIVATSFVLLPVVVV